ncbi:alpha carbonic anhydrase 7 [Prunus yedoensis var. nudiflora]|uniref:Carbonic anhydrase n=1 Tax=Prunus yedoensis var. nudiflora TaxID=2094558 RepID=A0A314ZTW9_PRUYE|nr:alpha carbonic anhydrase 7 [Prunus yedoensis var. nudiflora]
MEKFATLILVCSFLIVLVLLLSYQATSDEVEDEREFNYEDDSEKGPARWGEIRQEWSLCNKGSMQSPIDLLDDRVEVVSDLGRLQGSYRPRNATLKNRGHDIMLKWEADAGFIRINGTLYQLKQCHWHSPSEHTVNDKSFDLEVHLVHQSPTGKIAVTGILYKIGEPDPFLTSMMDYLVDISGTSEKQKVVGMVDPKQIKTGSTKYYRYIGSLTIPPCTQDVIWTIIEEVRSVSSEQVKFLRVAVHDESDTNARPVQPRNRRIVQLYKPTVEEEN